MVHSDAIWNDVYASWNYWKKMKKIHLMMHSDAIYNEKPMLLSTGTRVAQCIGQTINIAFNNQVHNWNNFL